MSAQDPPWAESNMPTLGQAFAPGSTMQIPHGREAAYRFAGFEPAKHIKVDGTISPGFEFEAIVRIVAPEALVFLDRPVLKVTVNRACSAELQQALNEIAAAGIWSLVRIYGGGFVPRLIRGGTELSMHALGLAVDFDPGHNPLGAAPAETTFGGTEDGRKVVAIFRRWGWFWGGHFQGRKDCQHFSSRPGAEPAPAANAEMANS